MKTFDRMEKIIVSIVTIAIIALFLAPLAAAVTATSAAGLKTVSQTSFSIKTTSPVTVKTAPVVAVSGTATLAAPACKCPDLNGDGMVTVGDITKIGQYYNHSTPKGYDLNSDGIIDKADLSCIGQYLNMKKTQEPLKSVCSPHSLTAPIVTNPVVIRPVNPIVVTSKPKITTNPGNIHVIVNPDLVGQIVVNNPPQIKPYNVTNIRFNNSNAVIRINTSININPTNTGCTDSDSQYKQCKNTVGVTLNYASGVNCYDIYHSGTVTLKKTNATHQDSCSADKKSVNENFCIVDYTFSNPGWGMKTVSCGNNYFCSAGACVINHNPIANQDNVQTVKNTAVTITPLTNDNDQDSHALAVTAVGSPLHGTTTHTSTAITYTPIHNYVGSDVFTYTISDGFGGAATSQIQMTVTVPPTNTTTNHAPVAQDIHSATVKNYPVVITLSASDADSDSLTYSIVTAPIHGSYVVATSTYTPASDFVGEDSFTYKANDGHADSNIATVTIGVADSTIPSNDTNSTNSTNHAPVSQDINSATVKNYPVIITLSASDADSDSLTYSIVTAPIHGSYVVATSTYTPAADYVGLDSFTYKANDGHADSNIANVTIQVQNSESNNTNTTNGSTTNSAPVALDDSVSMYENDNEKSVNVMSNDYDPDGDSFTIVDVSSADDGDTTYSSTRVYYQPDEDFYGTDSFTYTIEDSHGARSTATVDVRVRKESTSSSSDSGSSSSSSSHSSSTCTTTWECSSWTTCLDGEQLRTCYKKDPTCLAGTIKPETTRSCATGTPSAFAGTTGTTGNSGPEVEYAHTEVPVAPVYNSFLLSYGWLILLIVIMATAIALGVHYIVTTKKGSEYGDYY